MLYTVVASAARRNLDIWAYLRDALQRLAEGGVELADLLPDAWARSHPASVHEFRRQERETRAAAERAHRQARHRLTQTHTALTPRPDRG